MFLSRTSSVQDADEQAELRHDVDELEELDPLRPPRHHTKQSGYRASSRGNNTEAGES